MFFNIILPLVVSLVILSYMATSSIVTDSIDTKMIYAKVPFAFQIEKVLFNGVEAKCQSDPDSCINKYDSSTDEISLTFSDLSGYIPANMKNSNLNGGTFSQIKIVDNNTTVRLVSDIPDPINRKIYLNHYMGLEYSISPKCVSGSEDSKPPCSTDEVYHDYPTSLETRNAL